MHMAADCQFHVGLPPARECLVGTYYDCHQNSIQFGQQISHNQLVQPAQILKQATCSVYVALHAVGSIPLYSCSRCSAMSGTLYVHDPLMSINIVSKFTMIF